MTLWTEYLIHKPIVPFEPTDEEFDLAWEWIWKSNSPILAMKIIRRHALELHCGKQAAIGIFRRINYGKNN